jgi:HD-like signal output (HDOD) protein
VHTAREALMVLGLNVTSKAITGIMMRRTFPQSPHLERFWDASARIARLSGWLAQRLRYSALRPDDAYTFGLFRDCGIPILISRFPSYFETLKQANQEATRSFTEIEDHAMPANHAVVGYMLAQSWWLSEETIMSIRHHHDLDVLNSSSIPPSLNSRYMIAISQLAEHLLQHHSKRSTTHEWGKLGPSCIKLLRLNEEGMMRITEESLDVIETGG